MKTTLFFAAFVSLLLISSGVLIADVAAHAATTSVETISVNIVLAGSVIAGSITLVVIVMRDRGRILAQQQALREQQRHIRAWIKAIAKKNGVTAADVEIEEERDSIEF